MLHVALALAVAVAATALVSGVVRSRRRRFSRGAPLAAALDPLPAGVKHLADCVSDLSDLGIHLGVADRAARRTRLGVLHGAR